MSSGVSRSTQVDQMRKVSREVIHVVSVVVVILSSRLPLPMIR
jgi:hypothetical protein